MSVVGSFTLPRPNEVNRHSIALLAFLSNRCSYQYAELEVAQLFEVPSFRSLTLPV